MPSARLAQTPSQLFAVAHAPRGIGSPAVPRPLPPAAATSGGLECALPCGATGTPIVHVWLLGAGGERCAALDASGYLHWLIVKRTATKAKDDEDEAVDGIADHTAAPKAAIALATAPGLSSLRMRFRAAQLPVLSCWAAVSHDGDRPQRFPQVPFERSPGRWRSGTMPLLSLL